MKPFDEWLESYLAFQKKAGGILKHPLPTEPSQLHLEQQMLEPLRWEAEGFRAAATGRYYKAKNVVMLELWDKVAMTALNDISKARCNREYWAQEDSKGLCESLISRSFKVSAALKQGMP